MENRFWAVGCGLGWTVGKRGLGWFWATFLGGFFNFSWAKKKKLTPKKWKNWPQKLLIMGPDPIISQSSPDHSPQHRIDFSNYEIPGPDICSLICGTSWFTIKSGVKSKACTMYHIQVILQGYVKPVHTLKWFVQQFLINKVFYWDPIERGN